MAFKIGNKTAINPNGVFNVSDTSDSDGGLVTSREGNLNLDLSTGTIFEIPYPGNNKARLKEKLAMSNFPSESENKKITVAFIGRGAVKTSPTLGSLGTKTEWVGDWFWNYQWYTFSHDGNYLFYGAQSSGYDYMRRLSLNAPFSLAGMGNSSDDQDVRFDTNFTSISRYSYVSSYGGLFFNGDGSKAYAAYFSGSNHKIFSFTLSTPYDLESTITLIHTFDASSWTSDTTPEILKPRFYADGHVLMGVDNSGSPSRNIIAFYLDTAYDLSSVYKSEFVAPASPGPLKLATMNHNGDKVYVSFDGDNNTWEHTLSTPFDVSTISASYVTHTFNHQPGANTDDSLINLVSFTADSNGTPDSYIWLGDAAFGTATDKFVRWETSTSFGSRPTLLWDSDRISMLNDSAPPMPGSSEHDLYEFLVFDSATGAKQTGFHNDVGS